MYLEATKRHLTTEFLTLPNIIRKKLLRTHHSLINCFETKVIKCFHNKLVV